MIWKAQKLGDKKTSLTSCLGSFGTITSPCPKNILTNWTTQQGSWWALFRVILPWLCHRKKLPRERRAKGPSVKSTFCMHRKRTTSCEAKKVPPTGLPGGNKHQREAEIPKWCRCSFALKGVTFGRKALSLKKQGMNVSCSQFVSLESCCFASRTAGISASWS